jgi:HEPN domain-containing protein
MGARTPDTLDAFLRETLPWIDELFSKDGRPIHARPLGAARIIVDRFIIKIEGDTKDDYITKQWFEGIYRPVTKWYERRYGEDLMRPPKAQTHGFVLYFGSPLAFRVPLVLVEPGEDEIAWMRFPKEVLPGEEITGWFERHPPFDAMPQRRREAFAASTKQVATALRGIHNALMTADLGASGSRKLVSTVTRHLEKAAADATTGDQGTFPLAIWELQMASEKAMKGYLAQQGAAYPETHDLRALQRLASAHSDFTVGKKPMASMPSEKRVMAWRYSELAPPSANELFRIYEAALSLCLIYAIKMSRKYVFNNAAFQIRRPPWVVGDA